MYSDVPVASEWRAPNDICVCAPTCASQLAVSVRNATRSRVVLVLTSSPRFSLLGLTRGDKRAEVKQKLHKEGSFVIGANRWYVVRTTGTRVLLVKVQSGLVREIGLGDGRFAKTNKLLRAYLRAWEGGL